jgi:long-subunit acyl-CoA synthetase (AMP-forming)
LRRVSVKPREGLRGFVFRASVRFADRRTLHRSLPHRQHRLAGEICTRSYALMPGYWNDPTATAAAIDGQGWMHTGDIGALDAAPYLTIVGRI